MKEVYSRKWYLREERESRKYKRSSNRAQRENECKSKKTREVRFSGRMRF